METITKAHLICFVLSHFTVPLTRNEVMVMVHVWGRRPGQFTPTSNSCYWSPTGLAAGGKSSVLVKGLVTVAGKKGNTLTYALTDRGRDLASQCNDMLQRGAPVRGHNSLYHK